VFTLDPAIHRASLVAAVASGVPRLRVLERSEPRIESVLSAIEASLGPLPQADIIEPSDARDPDWELRVDLPELSAADALLLDESLAATPHAWSAASTQAATAAADAGLLLEDDLVHGVHARCLSVAQGLVTPDLWRAPTTDPSIRSTEAALVQALCTADPRLVLQGPAGIDTVQTVVHRSTGRAALELWFTPACFEGLDGDAVHGLRATALSAIAEVVAAPGDVPLDPNLLWWPHLGGTTFLVFLATKPGAALPADQAIQSSAEPEPSALGALIADEGFCHDLELQLLEADPNRATEHLLQAGATDAVGASPRWVDAAGSPVFASTWRIPCTAASLSFLNKLPDAFRLVPGLPVGLDEEERWTQKLVHWGPERVAVRLRDGAYDEDREPVTLPRPLTAADTGLLPHIIRALGPHAAQMGPEGVLAVVGSDGRHGLRIDLPRSAIAGAQAWLEALTTFQHPSVAAWVDVAFPRARGVRLHVWARMEPNGLRTYLPLGPR
jgi:hypothetical protein